jgi:hypothetical protein
VLINSQKSSGTCYFSRFRNKVEIKSTFSYNKLISLKDFLMLFKTRAVYTHTGTDTLTGSVATMHKSVLKFLKSARCSRVEALEAASLHPALALGMAGRKGSLAYGADADLIILDKNSLGLLSTWIGQYDIPQQLEISTR